MGHQFNVAYVVDFFGYWLAFGVLIRPHKK
jgi:hypothetical protein